MRSLLILTVILVTFSACEKGQTDERNSNVLLTAQTNDSWKDHWYDGKAEVNVYEVQQARYDDLHAGKSVLVFVTEDFLTDKQVKDENRAGGESTSVLKTNLMRHFNTGVYDYSLMTSVFTPIESDQYPKTLKITTSMQDWCGQSYIQMNLQRNKYKVQQYSYFENEGDRTYDVEALLTEDEILNRIRLNPLSLHSGTQQILPGNVFTRLKHKELKVYNVEIKRAKYTDDDFSGADLQSIEIQYPELDRTLEIIYEGQFPHRISGWKDTYEVFGEKKLTSVSKRISSERIPYWSQHGLEDLPLREKLGL